MGRTNDVAHTQAPSDLCESTPFNTCMWAWNDNIGWISHNSIDDPATPVFGVHVNEDSGTVEGHAWNDILGYMINRKKEFIENRKR